MVTSQKEKFLDDLRIPALILEVFSHQPSGLIVGVARGLSCERLTSRSFGNAVGLARLVTVEPLLRSKSLLG